MATRWAVQNGNWSATATWNGGTLPTSADDVYADGKTVTIDQNVTVLAIRSTQRSGGINGGSFTISGPYSVSASNGFTGTNAIVVSVPLGVTASLIGAISGSTYSGDGVGVVSFTGAGTLNVTGDISGTWNIIGQGIIHSGTGTLNVIGSVTGGAAPYINSEGIRVTGNGIVNITGPATANGLSSAIRISGGSFVTVTGTVTANSNHGILALSGLSTVSVTGTIIASTSHNGINSVGLVQASGPFISAAGGSLPVSSLKMKIPTGTISTYWEFRDTSSAEGSYYRLYSASTTGGNPSASNVRSGTVYGPSNELTGTLAVPPANAVASGVPVDNTTGTAALRPADIAGMVGAQIAAALTSPT